VSAAVLLTFTFPATSGISDTSIKRFSSFLSTSKYLSSSFNLHPSGQEIS